MALDGSARLKAAHSIPETLQQVAAEHARKIAVWDEESALTYQELDRQARQVASLLWQSGVDLERPLGVMAAHRPATAALLLGCLYAGGFYVVLDPEAPLARLSALLGNIRPSALLSDAEHLPQAENLSAGALPVLSSTMATGLDVSRFQLPTIDTEQPACLIYTSGTTGAPKGIVLSHRVVLARVRQWIEAGQLWASDRVSLLPSPGVNAGTRGMYSALLSGAQLCFYDLRVNGTHRLARWLKQAGITVFYTLPSVWDAFVETLGTTRLPDIRLVRLGGEALTEANVASFSRHFHAGCVLVNGYATTEAGTICLYFMRPDTKLTAGRVPVGYAAPGVKLELRDEAGSARHDRVGEVSILSESIAGGMWDGAARTVRAYPSGPFETGDLGYQLADGRVFLTGRKGLWLNLHGYRVNLTDLESALATLPEIEDVAAVADTQSGSETRLRVFYVLRQTMTTSEMRLHHAAAGVLPSATLSVTFHAVESLPRRVAGKLNRALLLQQIEEETATPLPDYDYQDPVEATLAEIWGLVLNQPRIVPEADFFALGGDSLLVFRAINRIQETFEIDLSVTQFFEAPTLAAQAALLRQIVWN